VTTITEQIADASRAEKAKAQQEYVVLVKRFHKAHNGDGKKLMAVCELLGIPIAEAETDAEAFQRMPVLLEHASKADELGKVNKKLHEELRAKRQEQRDEDRRLEQEVRTLLGKTTVSSHAVQLAGTAKKNVEQTARAHWRVFGAPAPSINIKYAHHGRFPREAIEDWLSDRPPRVFYHGNEGDVTLILKDRGYRDTGSDVWSRVEDEPGDAE